jgi:S-adenosylmethionine synthetase
MTTHQPAATHGGKARTMSNNNLRKILYTSESVGKGHPDKICDQISDAILDACLQQDQNARVACECFACNHLIVIGGEITTTAVFNPVQIAKSILTPLGYDQNEFTIISNINQQSTDIAKLVDKGKNVLSEAVGAGDQGITVGYATDETSNYMPLAIDLANEIVKSATKLIEHKQFPYANYDMKSQVTIDYSVPKKPKIDTLLVSIQHQKFPSIAARTKFKNFIKNHIFAPIVKKYHLNTDYKTFINQAGDFITGGPIADTGLTGRKIIVDNYGLGAHHGGGCYSGKDYTKVDRTGAYFAR